MRHSCLDDAGLGQGPQWVVSKTGATLFEGNQSNGKPDGLARAWDDEGLVAELRFKQGTPVLIKLWHPNGTLAEQWDYEAADRAHVRKWHENGAKAEELDWSAAGAEGRWLKWWPNGNPRQDAEWQGGVLQGQFRAWYENGAPRSEGKYASNRKRGRWRFWNEAGELERETTYDTTASNTAP